MKRDLADGEDLAIARAEFVVDDHAAARSDFEIAGAGQLVARPDAGGNDNHVDREFFTVGERQGVDAAVAEEFFCAFVQMNAHTHLLDLGDQGPRTAIVHLARHEPRSEFDNVRFKPKVEDGLRRFEAEQAAADHRGFGALRAKSMIRSRSSIVR